MGDLRNIDIRYLENKRFFDRWAKTYDGGHLSSWFQYTQNIAIDLLNLQPASKVLDVGCGTGFAVCRLAEKLPKGRACGIDLSPEMIGKATAKIRDQIKERIEFRCASSCKIPYPRGFFDNVMCTNSFHHYPDPIRSLREMQRVLKPGGELLILENAPDRCMYTWIWDRILRIFERGHVRYYTCAELGQMLRFAEYDDVELRYVARQFMKMGKICGSIQVWCCKKPNSNERESYRYANR